MLSKTSTSTSLILLGLTAPLANPFTSVTVNEYGTFDEGYAIESFYFSNPDTKSRVENYVDSVYRVEKQWQINYSNIDGAFFHNVQLFAVDQVELEKEFYLAMDDLLFSKINNTPSKKRF